MLPLLVQLLAFKLLSSAGAAQSISDACSSLTATLSLENTTIITAERITAGQNISTPGSCHWQSVAAVTADACRVYAVVNTTAESAVHFEVWLPDTWFGRFLALGNGGLGGCIDYINLGYGSALHFATVASDNGHDGTSISGSLQSPELLNDYGFRAIHVEAVLGKQIVDTYYGRTHDKSYFMGCSTGGRQAMQSAMLYPDDFDGMIAGAPATDFNHLLGWETMLGRFIGAPIRIASDSFSQVLGQWIGMVGLGRFADVLSPHASNSFIPESLWPGISQEILNQCDALDGVVDGIITEPDDCVFRPDALLCDATDVGYRNNCLTALQVDALTRVYEPLFGTAGQLLYPRYDPGAEADGNFAPLLGGAIFDIPHEWFRFAIYNDTNFSFENFSVADIEFADTINPGGISTWNGDLSAFQNRGGKIISYHGRRDHLIPSGNSKRLYDLIASTLSQRTLDEFYRLFLIPGMDHCAGGPGAWAIGQHGLGSNTVNDSAHNVLFSLVEWVEQGREPDVIVGTTIPGMMERMHCRYPQRSVHNGSVFVCQE
ncbi:tannase and feruloyl esterase [Gautieria morchelliformis]|nr:tannase and feruloyl esterase [Gautieria morchelliformis]